MFPPAVDHLSCPHCGAGLSVAGRTLGCSHGHRFDIARHGYVNLATGRGPHHAGDSAAMVAARERVQARGHLAAIADAAASMAAQAVSERADDGGAVVELGAGTGYHLRTVLDRLPARPGIALDASRYACRRAAKAHPRVAAGVCDVWTQVPVRTASAVVILDVFAPRNGPEIRRILSDSGVLVVVSPTSEHLQEIVGPLGLITVDPDKQTRVAAQLDPHVTLAESRTVTYRVPLDHDAVRDIVAMGPTAHHLDEPGSGATGRLTDAIAGLTQPVATTMSVTVSRYHPRGP